MIVSEERLSHLAYLIVDKLWKDDLVDYVDDDRAVRSAKKAMSKFSAELQDLDTKARKKVASLKRGVIEGSPEWDILYQKYFEEELSRSGN